MRSEDDPFQAHRDKPGRDTLRALLAAHQVTVFNLCFQVLRSAADAEDAAQETLLEIVRGVGRIREPRAFKRWLCRVALHTALDHRRRRHRRARHEETRAAMKPATPDPSADAIHEALAALEDEDRCLLVEKYFEQATLEEIGAREGVTAAAVGKRVDRAKERLKQRLSQAGLAALIPSVDCMLESARPATSAPPLNLEAALAGGPGAILTVKAAAILSLALLVGAAGAYAWKRSSAEKRIPAAPSIASKLPEQNGVGETASSDVAGIEVKSEARPSLAELLSRLARFRLWYEEFKPPRKEAGFSMEDPEETLQKVRAELAGVRDLIFKNPRVFLEWIALPENARCVRDLMAAILCEKSEFPEGALRGGDPEPVLQRYGDFPSELTEGLLRLLHGENECLREAILTFALTLRDAPPEWRARYQQLVCVDNEDHRRLAIQALLFTGDPSTQEFQCSVGLVATAGYDQTYPLLQELCRVESPEARNQVLIGLESGRIPDPVGQKIYYVVSWVLQYHPQAGEEFEERASRLLLSALPRAHKEYDCSQVVFAALHLQPRLAKPIVSKAATDGPTNQLRKAAAVVLATARMDEENWRIHTRQWMDLMRKN